MDSNLDKEKMEETVENTEEVKEEAVETAEEVKDETTETAEKTEEETLEDKLVKAEEQVKEAQDKWLRQLAEFENFRKRTNQEKQGMYNNGVRDTIEKFLPVVDNFERGVAALSEEDLDSPVGQGMNLIYKQMTAALEDMGVTVIEAEGKEFDPELHNAVMHEDNEELGENMVSQELQKGYKYRDSVVRHSMVKVAN